MVRINAVTEWALQVDVDSSGTIDSTYPLYYDPTHVDIHRQTFTWSDRISPPVPQTAVQALKITAWRLRRMGDSGCCSMLWRR